MSGVIKAKAANGSVRPFVASLRALQVSLHSDDAQASIVEEPPEAETDEEKEALLREIGRLKLALEAADKAILEAEQHAREEERLKARKAREAEQESDAEQLVALAASLGDMAKAWDERLAGLDGLAALIAGAALSKLFDSWGEAAEFVTRTIARQVRLVRREAIVAIRVSGADFPDEQALDALASRAATGSVRILVDPDMATGECRADLQLGHVDLGAKAQQRQLASLLESLAAAHEGAG